MIPRPRLPPPLRRGDRVGVAALSGPVDPERLEAGLAALADLGYEPVVAANLGRRAGLFAGDDEERLAAFHDLAARPDVRAVVFARGGSGVLRILPRIDWALLARYPRAYVGYSDLTPFLLQVVARLGIVAFHGPMVAADLARGLDDAERASFEAALAGAVGGELPVACCVGSRAGEGPLLGGCLSLLVATLGTPYAADLERSILFFEDVDEPVYWVDRMLTHLRLSGNLNRLEGMVAGHVGSGLADGREPTPEGRVLGENEPEPCYEDLMRELAEQFAWPVAWGLCAGHARPNLTLPLGAWTRLDPERQVLKIEVPGR